MAALIRQGDREISGKGADTAEVFTAFVLPHHVHLFTGTLSEDGRCSGELISRASIHSDASWQVKVKSPPVPLRFVCAAPSCRTAASRSGRWGEARVARSSSS